MSDVSEKFGVTSEQLDRWEEDASKGVLHGEPRGPVVVGRPRMFGDHPRTVGFKESSERVESIDRRAKQLGMRRSDYLRHLVDRDLLAN